MDGAPVTNDCRLAVCILVPLIIDWLAAIAIGPAAGRHAARNLTKDAPVRLLPQGIQVGFIPPAHDGGNDAAGPIGQIGGRLDREYPDPPEPKPTQRCVHLGLVAPEAVLCFDDDRVEAAGLGVLHELLVFWPPGGRPG